MTEKYYSIYDEDGDQLLCMVRSDEPLMDSSRVRLNKLWNEICVEEGRVLYEACKDIDFETILDTIIEQLEISGRNISVNTQAGKDYFTMDGMVLKTSIKDLVMNQIRSYDDINPCKAFVEAARKEGFDIIELEPDVVKFG